MRRSDFEKLVRDAVQSLPQEFLDCLDNVDVVVQDWPTREQLRTAGVSRRDELFGLYEGLPLTERDSYTMALPDKITIFRRPLEACCAAGEEIVQEVRLTVAHEIAHHFGISDERLEALGLE